MKNAILLGDLTPRVIELLETRGLNVLSRVSTDALLELFLSSSEGNNIQAKVAIEKIFIEIANIDSVIFCGNNKNGKVFIDNCIKIANAIPEKINVYFQSGTNKNTFHEVHLKGLAQRKIYVFYDDVPKYLKLLSGCLSDTKNLSVSIFGSCDSRDVIRVYDEVNPEAENINIQSYIARNSISAAMSKPIDIAEHDFHFDSQFIKKSVCLDLRKQAFREVILSLKNSDDVLLLDFMDERFDLLCVENSHATLSWDYRKTGHYNKNKNRPFIAFDADEKKEMTLRCLKFLISECAKKISLNNIFILNIPMATHFIDCESEIIFDEVKYQISRYNVFLRDIISAIEEKIDGVNIISPPSWMVYGDKNHLWGAHPYHYNKLLYLHVANEIHSRRVGS
ncbi:DUF6270 domain-containing protein [uncultured Aeromonas sp.]|uniref:DUF6270 domain-containing protein n=1 Tax=uncultured Aeromonas sp. TaxID=263763 RepID=UPI00259A2228|nr:DUF6270 domain-containing protein [uncultured Aeromonas sp.]